MTTADELQDQADALVWFHTIDLGQGVVTKGLSAHRHKPDDFPDFTGLSVLDIGAWDGYYSFLAERGGARRVVALDNYAWGVDFGARDAYWRECQAKGTMPDHSRDLTDFWSPELPGRRGFEFAKGVLGSDVEPMVGDFATMDLETLGLFDVVLYLGVLYHMEEPLTCLRRVRSVTNRIAVIETEALHIENVDDACLLQFHAGNALQADYGNWYVPTIEALKAMCRAAGFSDVQTLAGPPEGPPIDTLSRSDRRRRRNDGFPPTDRLSAPTCTYRAVVHAFV